MAEKKLSIATIQLSELQTMIEKWQLVDSQLKIINEKTKKIREIKHDLTDQICNYMEQKENANKIQIQQGELRKYEKKEYSPLTFNYVEDCLKKIIKNEDHVNYIIQYLKNNREIKTSQDIRISLIK